MTVFIYYNYDSELKTTRVEKEIIVNNDNIEINEFNVNFERYLG